MTKIAVEQVSVNRQITVEGQRQTLEVLSGVSFEVPEGGRLAIMGPSGSGKTSLLRLLNRLEDPDEGRVLLDGEDLRKLDPVAIRRRVGMVFQQPFMLDQSVEENLAYPLRLMNRDLPHERAVSLLREMNLPENYLERQAQQLSGGQAQRVAIARALVLEPEVLLLDEPTSALDEASAQAITDALINRNKETGLTLIMVTHSRDVLQSMDCPTILVHDGTIHSYPDPESALNQAVRERITLE